MKALKILIFLNIIFLHHAKSQIFVDASATGLGNGSSWSNAYPNLQNAINSATSGKEIWVKAGTYYPSRDRNGVIPPYLRNATFVLKEGVKLYGGFAGNETKLSERNPELNISVLSGDIGVVNDDSDNIFTLLLCVDLTSLSRLDGFTVTKANNNRPSDNMTIASYIVNQNSGGAGWILSSDIIITNNKFIGNKAGSSVGGLLIRFGSIQNLVNNVFTANETVNQAGAIYATGSSVSFDNCIFTENIAGQGGALYIVNNDASSGIINNCTFRNNKAKADGGAIQFYASDPLVPNEITITNSTFDNNTITPIGIVNGLSVLSTRGGAINSDRTNLNISLSTFSNNWIKYRSSGVAQGGAICLGINNATKIDKCNFINNSAFPYTVGTACGGGAIEANSELEISNCVFESNYSEGSGGAIDLYTSPFIKNKISIANSVFVKNTAKNAGAIYYGSNLASYPAGFTNLTFYGNTAKSQGGALFFSSSTDQLQQTTQLNNCIFEDNAPNEITYYSTFKSTNLLASNNHYQTDDFSGSLFNDATNPIGNDNVWRTMDDGLKINLCSLVVDAGINTNLIVPGSQNLWTANDLDITGNKRVIGEHVDLGAYESDLNTAPVLTGTLPVVSENAGAQQKVIDLNNYFSIAAGSKNSYLITSANPESGTYHASIEGNLLKISFHESLNGTGQIDISAKNACGLVSNGIINVTVSPKLSTNDIPSEDTLFLYPNPTDNSLMVSGNKPVDSYEIINMLGQSMQNGLFNNRHVEVKQLTTGVYFIIINSEGTFYKLKFYKK